MPSRIAVEKSRMATAAARAGTREEALRFLKSRGVAVVELDYESGWQDAVDLHGILTQDLHRKLTHPKGC